MTERATPTGPPRGPQWGQPPSGPPHGRNRSVLTHSLATLGGLGVGVLIGIVGTSSDDDGGSSPPPSASPSTTAPAAEAPPTTRTTPQAAGTAKTTAQEVAGDGTFLVGSEARPGTYRSAGPADDTLPNCYWARLKGTTGNPDEIIANGSGKGQATVTVLATDKAFQTSGCHTWKRIS